MQAQSEATTNKLLIIDGHAYAYRAFHAIRSLHSPAGQPTNAIFGFIKAVNKMRSALRPTHLVVVWDGGLAAERLVLLPQYKAQRPPMPPALEQQLDEIVAWLRASGLASHCQEGVEADDWIATLARLAVAAGARVVIASSDKDFMQLVGPRVGLLNPNDKTEAIWTETQVRAKTGVGPEQIVDWLSLVGDSSDNIPGVPGVGAKTAARLLQQFGSCDAVLARAAEIESEKVREALAQAGDLLRRNRDMVRLKDDLPGQVALEDLAPGAPNRDELAELYSGWGFRSLLREIRGQDIRQPVLL
jgi:DNA polymerase-1